MGVKLFQNKMINNKNKKAVSPVVATILLIAIVIVIALIVFFWFSGLTEETITKFGKKNIKLVCDDVKFEADLSNNILTVSNLGTVPIYNFNIKVEGNGGYSTQSLRDFSASWPSTGLNQGEVFSENIGSLGGLIGANRVTIIPVLAGKSSKGESTYACEDRHGFEVNL